MDATAAAAAAAVATNSTVRTPEAESETPTRIQPANGVLKRHTPPHLHPPVLVVYKECLKNHAASIGGHAVDGCGEFMPSAAANPADPSSLKCAACGCHRNFHRRDPDESAAAALEYHSLHRHHPAPPPPPRSGGGGGSGDDTSPDDSPSPPPISSSYYPGSAPAHVLLALSHAAPPPISAATAAPRSNSGSRKRFRTKFTQNQKEKMLELAEKVDWKLQKKDENLITEICTDIGVERSVFKVWMHNNKNTFGKRDNPPSAAAAADSDSRPDTTAGDKETAETHGTNGSSPSS